MNDQTVQHIHRDFCRMNGLLRGISCCLDRPSAFLGGIRSEPYTLRAGIYCIIPVDLSHAPSPPSALHRTWS